MTVITSKPVAVHVNKVGDKSSLFSFKGRNAVVRNAAFAGIASCAYAEGLSRATVISQLRMALGAKPSADEIAATRIEYIVGRVAVRLVSADLPNADMPVVERIAFARKLVTSYAAPLKDGVKARKLRKGQEGRRTVSQHKAIRASEEAWSVVLAELGLGGAQTQEQRAANNATKGKRAPAMAGSTKRGKGDTTSGAITHSELVKPDGPMTKEAACTYLASMSATMLAFCNKHAKIVPLDYGTAVRSFKASIDAAAKAEKAK